MTRCSISQFLGRIPPAARIRKEALLWGLPLAVAGLLYAVHLTGELFGDELITYEWASKGTALFETGKPPNLLNVDIMLSRLAIGVVKEPWALRIPSSVFGLLTVLMVGRLGKYLADGRTALISLWVAAFSPMLIEFAAEGRPYTIYCFFSTALLYYTLRFLEREHLRSALLLAGCAILGCLSRTLFVANLVFVGLFYLYRRRALTRHSAVIALLVLPFVLRLYLISQHYSAYAPKIAPGEEGVSLGNFIVRGACALNFGLNLFQLPQLGLARNVPLTQVLADNGLVAALSTVALIGLAGGFLTLLKTQQPVTCLLTAACVVPALVLIVLSATGYSIIREKYLIGILGPYCVLLALLFRDLANRSWGRGALLCFALAVAISLEHYLVKPEIYSRRTFAAKLNCELEQNASENDVAITYHFARRVPWYVGFFDRGDRIHIDLYDDIIQKGSNFVEFAHAINSNCPGRIYLVCDEGSRLWLDNQGELPRILGESRLARSQTYGRNLRLFVFEPRTPAGNLELIRNK